jgi:uncharacterized protein (DUF849 family)
MPFAEKSSVMHDSSSRIITCAVTGSSLTPSMSPHLPITPAEIVEQAVGAAEAGAAILHLHARNPEDGRPTNDLAVWREIVPALKARTDAIINMSASLGSTAEDRLSAVLDVRPDVATVIVGSMNYGIFRKAEALNVTEFKHDWEREYFFGSRSYEIVTQNTFAKIARMVDILVDQDIGIEFECYDVGDIYAVEYHVNRVGGLKRPVYIQFLTGIFGGIQSDIEHLLHMKQTAQKLFGTDCHLATHGTGPDNMRAACYGALMGTHIRIGQEDNVQERPGVLFKSNAEQVRKIVRIMDEFALTPAPVAEARAALGY